MTNTKDIIIKLQKVYKEKNLSYSQILDMMAQNGDYLTKATLSKMFSKGGENRSFDYEYTIRPIAKALLGIETFEVDDDMDTQAMKSLLRYKIQRIEELERQIDQLKVKHSEKLEKERASHKKSIEFLKEQVAYKDKRMDLLLQAVQDKDKRYDELLKIILSCPCRKKVENESE